MAKTPIVEIRRSRLNSGKPLTGKLASQLPQAHAAESEIDRVFKKTPVHERGPSHSEA